jgi:hypothetical protein
LIGTISNNYHASISILFYAVALHRTLFIRFIVPGLEALGSDDLTGPLFYMITRKTSLDGPAKDHV